MVKAATGEIVSGEDLGGATLHCSISGITDHFASTEQESFGILRDIISTLNIEDRTFPVEFDAPILKSEHLDFLSGLEIIEKENCYSLLATLTDGSRFSEFKKMFGENLIAGFGFLEGILTGFLINCGPITSADGQKGAHFVQLCDARDIPLIFLQNGQKNPPNESNVASANDLKERAKFSQSHAVARVPKISVNVGGIFGDELMTMCGPSFGPWFNFAWPTAKMSKHQPGGDAESAQFWAARMTLDEVISPAQTRNVLAKSIRFSLMNFEHNRWIRGTGKTVMRM